jgi:hypothetical protein
VKVTIIQNSDRNALVHKAGCADIRRRELRDRGYLSSWDADVTSQREAAVAAWSDHVSGGEMTRAAALGYTTFLPCCDELPEGNASYGMTFGEFMTAFDPDGSRTVADIIPVRDTNGDSPFVVVRYGEYTAVLALMPCNDHLCIDVHAFADGQGAAAGVFTISNGKRIELPATGRTSHEFPAEEIISVVIGAQGTEPATPAARPYSSQEGVLTERRKADREMMAGTVAELARQHDLHATVTGEQHGSRKTAVELAGPHGLKLTVQFRGDSPSSLPDTYVLNWHGADKDWRLNPAVFSDVNPHHGCKATDVTRGFRALEALLLRRFARIADGSAFITPNH